MKSKIVISKKDEQMNFYLVSDLGRFYLFTQRYTKGVYDFFYKGRSLNEIKSYKKWRKNPKLDKTIMKLPMYTQYVIKEFAF